MHAGRQRRNHVPGAWTRVLRLLRDRQARITRDADRRSSILGQPPDWTPLAGRPPPAVVAGARFSVTVARGLERIRMQGLTPTALPMSLSVYTKRLCGPR
jgi:hypothetical protein